MILSRFSRRRIGLVATAWFGASGLTAWSAIIHLRLWNQGYRHIPRIGPLFLAQGIAGLLVAGAVLRWRRPLAALAGAVFLGATAAGLVLSATVGVLGFHDGFDASYAGLSLAVEGAGMVLYALAAALRIRACTTAGRA